MQPQRIAGFLGANQALDSQLLDAQVGVVSLNQKPGDGTLRPWSVPLNVSTTSTSGRKTIYRFNADVASNTNYWFQWSTIVHAVRGFIADDTTERTYFSGDGVPKVTDNVIGLAGAPFPTSARILGIPAPTTAPVLTETLAGTGTDEDRYYLYTYLSDFGEESAPSPVSTVFTCKPGAHIDVTALASPPAGNYGINRIRLYRTQAGTSGAAEFFLLAEFAAATSTTDNALPVGSYVLESNGPTGTVGRVWLTPPSDLSCLIGLWNGMLAGITGKSVRYCEPNKPYAWPAAYETLCEATPKALVKFGKNLLVLTTGRPRVVTGSAPEAMDDEPLGMNAAIVSVTSAVGFEHGACWATPDGLAYAGLGGAPRILTDGLMEKEDWQALNPSTIVAAQYLGRYMGFYDSGGGVWKGFMVDPLNPQGVHFIDSGFSAVYYDALQEALFGVSGTDIQKWDAGAAKMTATFRSKLFRLPLPENPGAAEVIAADYGTTTFKLYADGVLKHTKTVTSREPFGLPAGYEPDTLQLEVSTTGSVTAAAVAGDVDGLKPV